MVDRPGPGKRSAAANVVTAESEAKHFVFESSVLRAAFVFKEAYYELDFLDEKTCVNFNVRNQRKPRHEPVRT